jgi:RNA polymerase sigma-70 factor (ECF subfamily)
MALALEQEQSLHRLDPDRLPDHVDALYRAAYALCGSRPDAQDLVQETFVSVLKRPRFIRRERELGYLLRALRNTYAGRYRSAARRPVMVALAEVATRTTPEPRFAAGEIMQAIAGVRAPYRDAVIAVDVVGLSYKQAARALRVREATITSRLHRGRREIARVLIDGDEQD